MLSANLPGDSVVITKISKEKACACANRKEIMNNKSKLIIRILEHTFLHDTLIDNNARI